MSRKAPKNNQKLDKYVKKSQKMQRRPTRRDSMQQFVQLMPLPRPKRIVNLAQLHKKSDATGLKQKPQNNIQQYLDNSSIEQILENCQALKEWVNQIQFFLDSQANNIEQKFLSTCKLKNNTKYKNDHKQSKSKGKVLKVIEKFFKQLPNSLWSLKYQPKSINELFDDKLVQQIILWIRAYKKCRHIPFFVNQQDSEESFIDDQAYQDFQNHDSQSIMAHVNQHKWKCRALILKGRPNVGKTSIVRVISGSLNYSIHQCSADLNQQKYLRQNNELTKSQNVQIAPKKQKIQKNNSSINKYFPILNYLKQQQSEKAQMNALQFIRDLNCVYPEKSRDKFYRYLSESIAMSKVPFVLTTSSFIPNQYEKYDVMQLTNPKNYQQKIAEQFWIIYLVQKALGSIFNRQLRNKKVKQGYFWSEFNFAIPGKLNLSAYINKQNKNDQNGSSHQEFLNHLSIFFENPQKTVKLVRMFQYNLNLLFNFLQFKPLQKAYEQSALKLQRIGTEALIQNQYKKQYLKSIKANNFNLSNNQISPQNQIQNIQFQGTNDTVDLQGIISDQNLKTDKTSEIDQQHFKSDKQSLRSKIHQLKLQRLADIKFRQKDVEINCQLDYLETKANAKHFKYQKLFYEHSKPKVSQNFHQNIPIQLHRKVKMDICNDFTRQTKERRIFANQYHASSLKPSQLSYLPIMAIVRRNRKAQITFEETLNKFTHKKRVHYLKQFSNIDFQSKQDKKTRYAIEKYLILD